MSTTHDDNKTRGIDPGDAGIAPPPIQRSDGYVIPWVIEFRILGTASILQLKVVESMIMGRGDKKREKSPDIDLNPYGALQNGISRIHAQITARNNQITIRDLNSSNGTYINNGRLKPQLAYQLHHGDRLRLGKLDLQVSFIVTPSSRGGKLTKTDLLIPKIGEEQWMTVVESEEEVAKTLGYVLVEAGFNVIAATNLTEGLSIVEQILPFGIIMEIMLPDGTGLDLIQHIRERDDGKDLPIIVITNTAGGYRQGQAFASGASQVLSKPVGVDQLIETLIEIMDDKETS